MSPSEIGIRLIKTVGLHFHSSYETSLIFYVGYWLILYTDIWIAFSQTQLKLYDMFNCLKTDRLLDKKKKNKKVNRLVQLWDQRKKKRSPHLDQLWKLTQRLSCL